MDSRELIQELRVRVGAVRTDAVALPGLSIGVEEIDEHLSGGGLARGALHEFVGGDDDLRHGAAPALLAATVLGREGTAVLWVVSREDLFPRRRERGSIGDGRLMLGARLRWWRSQVSACNQCRYDTFLSCISSQGGRT